MQRREFMMFVGGAAAVLPHAARAQQAAHIYRLGLMTPSANIGASHTTAFFDELRLLGFVEGQNLKVDGGGYGLRDEQLPEIVAAMAKSPPDVIFCTAAAQMRAAQGAMRTVPIVGLTTDMIANGLVKSVARPDGNITGVSLLSPQLNGKRQDIIIEAVPGGRRMAILAEENNTPQHLKALQDAGRARGIEIAIFTVRIPEDIAPAMNEIKMSGAAAINVLSSALLFVNRRLLFKRADELRLPAIYEWPEMAEEGGLIGYGARLTGIFRQAARMVAKALRGVKPADIPIEQPTNFELVINLKTAQAIGHEVPAALVLRADRVIE